MSTAICSPIGPISSQASPSKTAAAQVDAAGKVVWEYKVANDNKRPTSTMRMVRRLDNGNTLISDQFNNRVIEITPSKDIVFQQGALNPPGDGFNRLNGPYDAKVVGDFTGLTPPFDED